MDGDEVVLDTGGGELMIFLAWLLGCLRLLLVILLLLIVAMGLVLAFPFHYRLVAGVGKDGWHLRSAIRWAWGAAVVDSEIINGRSSFQVRVFGRLLKGAKARIKTAKSAGRAPSAAPTPARETKTGATPNPSGKDGDTRQVRTGSRRVAQELRRYLHRPMLTAAVRLFRRLYVALHLDAVIVRGVYGFSDPCVTGQIAAWGHGLGGALPFFRWRMVPVFDDPTLELELELRGWLSPFALIWWVAEFGFCNAVRPLWFGQLFSRFGRKQKKGSGVDGTERVSRNVDEGSQQDVVVRKRSRGTDYSGTSDHRSRRVGLFWVRDRRRRGEG